LADLADLELRVTATEVQLEQLVTAVSWVNERIDGIDVRLAQIERPLDLVGEPTNS